MLRKLKKSVAVVLVATFIMSMFVIAPSAAEKENENVAVNTSDYSISGYDSFGEMLASDISDKNEEIMQANEEFSLLDVTVNGNVAMVDYEAKEDCTILVAVYDDVTEKMLASGKSQALANQDSVEVSIETEVMPEYFILKAFMLDDNNAPLTGCYVEERYTEGVQQVVELEASQFDEERVLNLDDDMSTNFAVYNENTILVEASEQNIPAEIDEDNETYVFTMCDEKLTSLTAGDIFVYEYEDGNVLIVKIKEISIDGTTVTITGDSNVELEDVFDYVKIEANQNADNATVDMSNADAGVTYEENVPQKADKACASVGKKWDGEVEAGKEFNIGFGKDDDKIKGTVGAKIVFGVEVEVYINNRFWKYKSHYIDFDFSYGVYFTGKIEVEVSKEISKKLADIQVPIVTGVNFNLSPQLEAKFSGSIEFTASIEGSLGFKASLGKGVQGKSESPDFSCSLELSGDLFIGLNINPGLSIIDRRVAKVELECTAGLNLHAETKVGTSKDDDDCGCKVCIKGKLSPQIKFGASIELATKTVGSLEVTFDLFSKDFYYSVDHNRFGFGECPYVNGGGSTDTTDPEPTSAEPATTPKPTTSPIPDPDPQPTTEPGPTITDSGVCGDNITYEYLSDGTLKLNGTGDMYNYDLYTDYYDRTRIEPPWYSYRSNILKLDISKGVTTIGHYAFDGATNLKSVILPDGITQIGYRSFESSGLNNIVIPESVSWIRDRAFSWCCNLTISLPESIFRIEEKTFYYCKNINITLPKSLGYVDNDAFEECTGVAYFKGNMPTFNSSFFRTYMTYYYPKGNTTWASFDHNYNFNYFYLYPYDYENNTVVTEGTNSVLTSNKPDVASVSSQSIGEDTDVSKINAEYSKTPYADYIIAVVKDPNAEDVLSADNLLYINQYTADKDGKISASMPVSDDVGNNYEVLIFGAEGGADVPDTPKKGDVNGDGKVNIDDVTLIQKYLANMADLDSIQLKAADLNGDENANIDDVTMIQKFLAGMVVLE